MTNKDSRGMRERAQPIRQPYHWPRGSEIREPNSERALAVLIVLCALAACALVLIIYLIVTGRY